METITKAVTLAAGRGTRMKDLTADCPKPMLPLGDRPMLAHQIERLEAAGIREVLIVVGYREDIVKDYFAANPPAQATLSYVTQVKQDGTGSAALLARDFVGYDAFLMTYGDNLVEPEVYSEMLARAAGAEMVLSVKWVEDPYHGGAVYTDGDRVTKIIEKPPQGTSTTHWNNAGIYIFRPSVFAAQEKMGLSPRGEYELTDAVHELVNSGKKVGWYDIKGFWRDVGRPEDLSHATEFVKGG
ncbi:MAG: sugar phosphate nucleotidyltransferase [Acidobacteria bacterium]|nr:sugar phosphate nucleotidyltransferase [Acidobacteriota bacterium]MDA1237228.1 sugar phosphate nucleotidyltransferase [Acidobacteriota bacterium]